MMGGFIWNSDQVGFDDPFAVPSFEVETAGENVDEPKTT
jgi:hypothetical protein